MFDLMTYISIAIIIMVDLLSIINAFKLKKAINNKKILDKNKASNKLISCQTLAFALSFFLFLIMMRHDAYIIYIRIYIIAHLLLAILYVLYAFIVDLLIVQIKYNNENANKKGELKRPTAKRKDREMEED